MLQELVIFYIHDPMKSEIIAEQFESMHGLEYTEVIGDEDSSVFHTIQATVIPYSKDVQEVECTNHAVKCFRKLIRAASKGFSIFFRGRGHLIKSIIMKITNGARCVNRNHSKINY